MTMPYTIYDDIVRVAKGHDRKCLFARAVRCPAAIECEHGYDVCPTCDSCTCSERENGSDQ